MASNRLKKPSEYARRAAVLKVLKRGTKNTPRTARYVAAALNIAFTTAQDRLRKLVETGDVSVTLVREGDRGPLSAAYSVKS